MNILDNMNISGKLKITKIDAYGNKTVSMHKNLVVTTGLRYIAERLVNTGTASGHTLPAEMSHMRIGTSSTATAASQTGLLASVGVATGANFTVVVNTPASNSINYTGTFLPGNGTGVLREAGIFNGSDNGVTCSMLCRTVFPTVTKQADDTIIIEWTVTIAAA